MPNLTDKDKLIRFERQMLRRIFSPMRDEKDGYEIRSKRVLYITNPR